MASNKPVLVLSYNRPDLLEVLLQRLAGNFDRDFYFFSDGPKDNNPLDWRRVSEARDSITRFVDLGHNASFFFQDNNLGCRKGVSAGLNWFFENVEAGIVLEDDCIPAFDFLRFCDELLDRYRENPEVWGIGGDNSFSASPSGEGSYGFTKYPLIWGWATWRDRWQKYDAQMDGQGGPTHFDMVWDSNMESTYFSEMWSAIRRTGNPDSWAFPLSYTVMAHRGLWVFPRLNLVCNIGHGEGATHTRDANSARASATIDEGSVLPIRHPVGIRRSVRVDREIFLKVYKGRKAVDGIGSMVHRFARLRVQKMLLQIENAIPQYLKKRAATVAPRVVGVMRALKGRERSF